jgi:hypothetical protein
LRNLLIGLTFGAGCHISAPAYGQQTDLAFIARCILHLSQRPPIAKPAEGRERVEDRDPCWELIAVHHSDGAQVNKQAQMLHGVDKLREAPYSLTGKKMTIAVVDGGLALASHIELAERVTLADKTSPAVFLNGHATHVVGTITASGAFTSGKAQGMAFASSILSYHWGNDIKKLADAVARGATVSNHSYGRIAAWSYGHRQGCPVNWVWFGRDQDFDSVHFGRYDDEAAAFDRTALAHPSLSIFVAAGNERNWQGEPDTLGPQYFDGRHCILVEVPGGYQFELSTKPRARHSRRGGFDTMSGHSVAKNVITVGAMADLKDDWVRADIKLTNFSSFGPTDDGRIKPDVIANGELLYSTAISERCEKKEKCDPATVP